MKIILGTLLLIGVLILILINHIRPDPTGPTSIILDESHGQQAVSIEQHQDPLHFQEGVYERVETDLAEVDDVREVPIPDVQQISTKPEKEEDLFEVDPGFGGGFARKTKELPTEKNYETEKIQIEYCN